MGQMRVHASALLLRDDNAHQGYEATDVRWRRGYTVGMPSGYFENQQQCSLTQPSAVSISAAPAPSRPTLLPFDAGMLQS